MEYSVKFNIKLDNTKDVKVGVEISAPSRTAIKIGEITLKEFNELTVNEITKIIMGE